MKRNWFFYLTTNIYFLGLSTMSQTLSPLVYPLLVQQFVGEEAKGTFFGTLRLWSLMVALLAQAFWGILSDRTTLRWGRRRPYILGGTIVDLIFIALIGFSFGLSGWTGFGFLFVIAILLQISSNAAQAAQQAVIPDLVPENQRGRFSAIKAVFEVPLPVILVAFTVGKMVAAGNLAGALLVAVGALVVSMILAMFIPEEALTEKPPALDWQPFVRLALMTALFTVIILGLGQGANLIGSLLMSINDVTTLLMIWGVIGLAAMIIAVALGVYSCVQLSLGAAAKLNPSFAWWVINRLAFLVGAVNISTFVVFFLQGRLGLVKEKAAGPAASLLLQARGRDRGCRRGNGRRDRHCGTRPDRGQYRRRLYRSCHRHVLHRKLGARHLARSQSGSRTLPRHLKPRGRRGGRGGRLYWRPDRRLFHSALPGNPWHRLRLALCDLRLAVPLFHSGTCPGECASKCLILFGAVSSWRLRDRASASRGKTAAKHGSSNLRCL